MQSWLREVPILALNRDYDILLTTCFINFIHITQLCLQKRKCLDRHSLQTNSPRRLNGKLLHHLPILCHGLLSFLHGSLCTYHLLRHPWWDTNSCWWRDFLSTSFVCDIDLFVLCNDVYYTEIIQTNWWLLVQIKSSVNIICSVHRTLLYLLANLLLHS